jgi:hypothetical protein
LTIFDASKAKARRKGDQRLNRRRGAKLIGKRNARGIRLRDIAFAGSCLNECSASGKKKERGRRAADAECVSY